MMAAGSHGALHGLVVLDLTQMLAGPYASMMLADHGARVIKIEPPGGEQTRRTGPHLEGSTAPEEGGFNAYFASINRGKESLVLDLKKPGGKALFLQLVQKADVLVENYRSGVMDRLGLSYELLAEHNPRLVYAALRGFGDRRGGDSPYIDWPAYDPIAQAMGGLMGITGSTAGGPPTKVGPGVGDILPAMFLAFGIASACWSAQRTGKGQFVDVSMVDSVLAVCERMVFQYSATGVVPGPEGNGHPLISPFGLFPAKDGFVTIGIPRDNFWKLFVELAGMPQLASDPRYATTTARLARREEVDRIVSDWTSARTMQALLAVLGGKVPFAPVFSAADIFKDAHFRQRDMLVEVEHPGTRQRLTIANTPLRMSQTPGGVRGRAPLVGEHTATIACELGLSAADLARLRSEGVLASPTTAPAPRTTTTTTTTTT